MNRLVTIGCIVLVACIGFFSCSTPVSASTQSNRPSEAAVSKLIQDGLVALNNEDSTITPIWVSYAANDWPVTFNSTSKKVSAVCSGPYIVYPNTCNETITGLTVGSYTANGTLVKTQTSTFANTWIYNLNLTGGEITSLYIKIVSVPNSQIPPNGSFTTFTCTVNGLAFDVINGKYL